MSKDNTEKLQSMDTFRLYTLTEVEPILGVSHRTLLEYVQKQKIKAVKIGGKWKISEENLKAFINGASTNNREE